jgi:hypothetical protein
MNQPNQVISDPVNTIGSYLGEIEYGQQIPSKLAHTLREEPSLEEWAAALELTIDQLVVHLQAGDLPNRIV